jgi:hypothetical protein
MHLNRGAKIVITLAIVFSILLIVFPHTSLFTLVLNGLQNATTRNLTILSILLLVWGLAPGILLITNKELKKKENRLVWITVLMNPCLMTLLTTALILSSRYLHLSPDVEFVGFALIILCGLVAWLIAVVSLIKWMKNKNKTTSNYPHSGA